MHKLCNKCKLVLKTWISNIFYTYLYSHYLKKKHKKINTKTKQKNKHKNKAKKQNKKNKTAMNIEYDCLLLLRNLEKICLLPFQLDFITFSIISGCGQRCFTILYTTLCKCFY